MGTRALSKIGKVWVVTQYDGDILGEIIRKIKYMSQKDMLKHIDNIFEIRAKANTRDGALRKYFGRKYTQEDYDTHIEYEYK